MIEAHKQAVAFEPDCDGGVEWNVTICRECNEPWPCEFAPQFPDTAR